MLWHSYLLSFYFFIIRIPDPADFTLKKESQSKNQHNHHNPGSGKKPH